MTHTDTDTDTSTNPIKVGDRVHIGPEYHGDGHLISMGYGTQVFEVAGETRHPYNFKIRELEHGTTWHVAKSRLTLA